MKDFTRFENQYIFMLASRAFQELEKEEHPFNPNVPSYIESLKSIAEKAGANMKEWDKREKVKNE